MASLPPAKLLVNCGVSLKRSAAHPTVDMAVGAPIQFACLSRAYEFTTRSGTGICFTIGNIAKDAGRSAVGAANRLKRLLVFQTRSVGFVNCSDR